jgi:CRISPR-associated protein Cas2
MALAHVMTCDISDERRRARVAAVPEACGDRVQRSVLVATVEDDTLREARDRISQTINPATDSVYVFRQCAACWEAVGIYGRATVSHETLYWAVL